MTTAAPIVLHEMTLEMRNTGRSKYQQEYRYVCDGCGHEAPWRSCVRHAQAGQLAHARECDGTIVTRSACGRCFVRVVRYFVGRREVVAHEHFEGEDPRPDHVPAMVY